jgi:hypothetical protein
MVSLNPTANLVSSGEATGNQFAWSVASAGDVDGDGYPDAIVGARGYNSYQGRAYLYRGGSAMDATVDLTLSGQGTQNYFGNSVAPAGDVDGDGYADALVGAFGYNGSRGRVTSTAADPPWTPPRTWSWTGKRRGMPPGSVSA